MKEHFKNEIRLCIKCKSGMPREEFENKKRTCNNCIEKEKKRKKRTISYIDGIDLRAGETLYNINEDAIYC